MSLLAHAMEVMVCMLIQPKCTALPVCIFKVLVHMLSGVTQHDQAAPEPTACTHMRLSAACATAQSVLAAH